MWIFRNDSMLSVVEDRDRPTLLLVRARVEGDIEKVFPNADVVTTYPSDYEYRAWIPRQIVAREMYNSIMGIDYTNFKDSIDKSDIDRKMAYSGVWGKMYNYQEQLLYEKNKKELGRSDYWETYLRERDFDDDDEYEAKEAVYEKIFRGVGAY